MIVLDTNVLSELLRPKPEESVRRWVERQPAATLFTTAICQAEILYGVALLSQGRRRTTLAQAVAAIFDHEFAGRILPFDSAAANGYASIVSARRAIGRPISQSDAQIAAIVASLSADLATRNVADFADCGIDLLNPWQ